MSDVEHEVAVVYVGKNSKKEDRYGVRVRSRESFLLFEWWGKWQTVGHPNEDKWDYAAARDLADSAIENGWVDSTSHDGRVHVIRDKAAE